MPTQPNITHSDNTTATTVSSDTVTDDRIGDVAAGGSDADVGLDNLSDLSSAAPDVDVLQPQTQGADTAALTAPAQAFSIARPETEAVEDKAQSSPAADITPVANDKQQTVQADNNVPVYVYQETSLLKLAKSDFAVQLAVLSSDAALTRFTAAYPELEVLSYQRQWQGKMQLVLVLAPFNSSEQAKQQMAQLPAALRATGPFVKSVQAIQAEIKARQLSLQAQ